MSPYGKKRPHQNPQPEIRHENPLRFPTCDDATDVNPVYLGIKGIVDVRLDAHAVKGRRINGF